MALSIRRLGPGDEEVLRVLALEDADFDIEGRGEPRPLMSPEPLRRFLENPSVLHWAAFEEGEVAGFLFCLHLPLRTSAEGELLLYEIGVRTSWRRRGVGRALLAVMEEWMRANTVTAVWVLADNPEAEAFYRACGFSIDDSRPTYLLRSLNTPEA